MLPVIGRWLGSLPLETKKLVLALKDLAEGAGSGVSTTVEGREMVFRMHEEGRGFFRIRPEQHSVKASFPRGPELLDPKGTLSGPEGMELSCSITHQVEIDMYFRRLVSGAFRLEELASSDKEES